MFLGKNFIVFKIALSGKFFVVWFFNILTLKMLKISQEFLTFLSFLEKPKGFSKKNLIFWKTDTVVRFVLGGVRSIAFAWEVSKRKRSDFRFSCENRWFFFEKKPTFSQSGCTLLSFIKKGLKWSFWLRPLLAFKNWVFLKKTDSFSSKKYLKVSKFTKLGKFFTTIGFKA